MGSSSIVFAGLLVLLFVVILRRGKPSPSRAGRARWFLARAVFPSWRFFEDIGHVPRLHYRVEESGDAMGNWQALEIPVRRRWHHLFLNPHGNLALALHGLLEQTLEEANVASCESIAESVSYKLLEQRVRQLAKNVESKRFQFKIEVVSQRAASTTSTWSEDVLISREHEV